MGDNSTVSSLDLLSKGLSMTNLSRNPSGGSSVLDEIIDNDVFESKFRAMSGGELFVMRRLSLVPSNFTFLFVKHVFDALGVDGFGEFGSSENLLSLLERREWVLKAEGNRFRVLKQVSSISPRPTPAYRTH